MTAPSVERLAYSIPEAAAAIGRSPDTIRRAIKRGDLAVFYPDSKPSILASELTAWLASLPTERPNQ